ncbi:MAG: S41 family peptidase [Brockia lithotrophica]|nr:S41 family peptidase [Brockia lithotrophica]
MVMWRASGRRWALLLFVFLLGVGIGRLSLPQGLGTNSPLLAGPFFGGKQEVRLPAAFAPLAEAYGTLQAKYYDPSQLNDESLARGAVKGMLEALGDPYTAYMTREELARFQESLSTSIEGIGAEVMLLGGRVTVISPIEGSPAERAGIRPNDQIVEVNGESLEGLDLTTAVNKIRGPKGTKAVLKVLRPGHEEPIVLEIVRDRIPLETVRTQLLEREGKTYAWIRVTSFNEDTAERFLAAMRQAEEDGAEGFLVDLRGNPGGYLEAAKKILEALVPREGVMYMIEGRDGKREVAHSKLKGTPPPLVVLVDEGSASASEIVAASLKAHGYPVVGVRSFGKGTVQSTADLASGGALKLTIAKWLDPNGEWIHGKGVEPTVVVEPAPYAKLPPVSSDKPLGQGQAGKQVEVLQKTLAALGYAPGREDGYFDAGTAAALRKFQADHGLSASGEADPATQGVLWDALYQKIRNPDDDPQLQKALEVLAQEPVPAR